jgi:hypothetical protein
MFEPSFSYASIAPTEENDYYFNTAKQSYDTDTTFQVILKV